MGMMDRDYAHEKRERPFGPPQRRGGASTLTMILVFLALLYAFFRLGEWALEQQAARKAPPRTSLTAPAIQQQTEQPRAQQVLPRQQTAPAMSSVQRPVTKCVMNGKTSYGDEPCLAGATVTQVSIKSNHNLMDAVRMPVHSQTDHQPTDELVIAQSGSATGGIPVASLCAGLNQQVENWDAMARRPQSGQMQDRIRTERKKLRDEQYRLKC